MIASDGEASTPLAITVTDVADNQAPAVTSAASASLAENGTGVAYQATATDPDGDPVTWTLSGADAALFTVDAATGAVSVRAAPDFEAPGDQGSDNTHDLTVTGSDGALSDSQTVAITVADVNEAPAVSGPVTGDMTEDGALLVLDLLANASNPDAGAVLDVIFPNLSQATMVLYGLRYDDANRLTLDPSAEWGQSLPSGPSAPLSIFYHVSDGAASTPASLTFTVHGVNDAPTAPILAERPRPSPAPPGPASTTSPAPRWA